MGKVDQRVLANLKHQQQNSGSPFHSLTLSDEPNIFTLEQFDTHWQYDPHQKGIMRSLSQDLHSLSDRL